ncbi:ATP-dependent helicase [Paenibacillus sp. WLX2291]|uniref:ATP-dependent helicase n=1 Tax=Paenibacillus sp. WLX2291 TaxID=3296934 RepID=UPI00398437B7
MLQKTIDRLTGKDKLLTVTQNLEQEVQQLQYQYNLLKKDNDEKTEQLIELIRLYKELRTSHESNLKQMKTIQYQNQQLIHTDSLYKKKYGEIKDPDTNGNLVQDLDEDKGFFDHIERIKGNAFNTNQVLAIRYNMQQNLRIIAGAGSGKTETICAKTAYLMLMEGVSASHICMVTFTRKAADEMRERVHTFLNQEKSKVTIGTFHSVFKSMFERLLKEQPGLASVGIVVHKQDDSDSKASILFRNLVKKNKLSSLDREGEKTIRERIDYWTNLDYTLDEMKGFVATYYSGVGPEIEPPIQERFYNLYTEFMQERNQQNIVIFDDYLLNLYTALQQYESAREFIQNNYKYIFVDEFQDINPLQVAILKLIAPLDGSGAKLIIVGDDGQSIYAFRGSSPEYIKDFHSMYDTYTLELMTNYRSKQNIVQSGNRVILHNQHDRIEKQMNPYHELDGDAYVWVAADVNDEAKWIIEKVQSLGKRKPFVSTNEKDPSAQPINYTVSTVLYRSAGQLQGMYQVLDTLNIPFVIESNEDIMGIFNLYEFKQAFSSWNRLVKENASYDSSEWTTILRQVALAHFVKVNDFKHFIKDQATDSISQLLQSFVNFIQIQKPYADIALLKAYFNGLFKLFKDEGEFVNVMDFIDPFLQFPANKKNLTNEELDWITKECTSYATWESLTGYHDRLQKRKVEMKKNVEAYRKGEYNALCFMTIHKSKGLAFDNVFVIGVYHGGLPSIRALPVSQVNLDECREKAEPVTTLEEERRLMYVAVTRAKHNVYITFPQMSQNQPVKRSIFIKELGLPLKNK